MRGTIRTLLVIGISLLLTACGRKGALMYPDMLVPAAPAVVSARQSGSEVLLQLAISDKDRAGRPLQGVTGVKINRRAQPSGQQEVCRACVADFTLFRTLYLDALPLTGQRSGNTLALRDTEVQEGTTYAYMAVLFTADGSEGAASPPIEVRVAAPQPAPVLSAESLPAEVVLHMSVQPVSPARLLGYNLYRSAAGGVRSFLPLNREPLQGNVYVDTTLERGVTYRYRARAVVVSAAGDVLESLESQELEGMFKEGE